MNIELRSFSRCRELREKSRQAIWAKKYVLKGIGRVKGCNNSIKL